MEFKSRSSKKKKKQKPNWQVSMCIGTVSEISVTVKIIVDWDWLLKFSVFFWGSWIYLRIWFIYGNINPQ